MNLFLSDMSKSFDLFKADPKTPGSSPGTGAGMSKTPGAVSGGGKQVVDCPLGGACPDGGKHQMGSQKLQDHTKQAQAGAQTGQKAGDESKGQDPGKPGVQPGSQNIGSLGSDQVKKPVVNQNQVDVLDTLIAAGGGKLAGGDKTQQTKLDPQEKKLRRNESRAKDTKVMPAEKQEGVQSSSRADQTQIQPVSQQAQTEGKGSSFDQTQKMSASGFATTQRQPPPVAVSSEGGSLAGKKITSGEMHDQAKAAGLIVGGDDVARSPADHHVWLQSKSKKLLSGQEGPGTAEPWQESVEDVDSQPADHYRLSQVAKDSGDHKGAAAQLEQARKKSEKLSSAEHKELGEQLRAEGLDEHADYHDSIHSRVQDYKGEQPAPDPEKAEKHDSKMKTVQDKQSSKASQAMKDAKDAHEKTRAKAKEIAEKAKAEGKKPAADKTPKKPELTKPSSDGEKLKHENHTARAKRTADMIESHLKNNPDLAPEDRRRLERAHKMAVFHQNVEFTPTAQHKQELGEVEKTAKELGIKEHWDDIQTKQDAKHTAQAKKEADKEEAQKAKTQKPAPKAPEAPIEHAKVADHRGRAKKLREKLQSHKDGNPNMSEEDHAVVDQLMQELDEHENIQHVPDQDIDAKLKEMHKLAGDMGKDHYKPEEEGGEASGSGGLSPRRDFSGYLLSQFHSGRAAGAGMAASATSPYGAAGHLAPQIAGYGLHGATSAGHRLLQRTEDGMRADKLDKEKDAQAKETEKQQKQANKADSPDQRGLSGGN